MSKEISCYETLNIKQSNDQHSSLRYFHPIYVSERSIIDIFTLLVSEIQSVIALFTLIFPNITSKILNESFRSQ